MTRPKSKTIVLDSHNLTDLQAGKAKEVARDFLHLSAARPARERQRFAVRRHGQGMDGPDGERFALEHLPIDYLPQGEVSLVNGGVPGTYQGLAVGCKANPIDFAWMGNRRIEHG